MRLGFFTMPVHPIDRAWSDTLREDREAVILADELGFHDAFIGEHLTDRYENITNSLLFLATLVSDTRRILLATGTTNLSHTHPVLIAVQSAMFDHLSNGRFILGVSPGALPTDAEILGILGEDRNQLFVEAIEIITRLWELDPPYNIDLPGNRFKVSTAQTMDPEMGTGVVPRPLQTPRPEIVGTVVAPFSKGVIAMGAKDFHPLSANFLQPKWVATHWPNYVEGKNSVGAAASTADWRVARTICVADDSASARRYAIESEASPYRFYYGQLLQKMSKLGRLNLFKTDTEQPDGDVTLDGILKQLVIAGDPDEVANEILLLRSQTGDFGEIVYAGLDWEDKELARTSMELMAREVMPRINAELGLAPELAATKSDDKAELR